MEEEQERESPTEEVVITHSRWHPNHPRLPEGTSMISFGLMPFLVKEKPEEEGKDAPYLRPPAGPHPAGRG